MMAQLKSQAQKLPDRLFSRRPANPCKCGQSQTDVHPSGGGKGALSLFPALTLVLLPKCPLCLAAWFGVLGSVGADTWLRSVWGTPLAVILLGITLASIGFRAWSRHDLRPFLLAVLSAVGVFYGKYVVELRSVEFGGMALLACASVWSGWASNQSCRSTAPSTKEHAVSSGSIHKRVMQACRDFGITQVR